MERFFPWSARNGAWIAFPSAHPGSLDRDAPVNLQWDLAVAESAGETAWRAICRAQLLRSWKIVISRRRSAPRRSSRHFTGTVKLTASRRNGRILITEIPGRAIQPGDKKTGKLSAHVTDKVHPERRCCGQSSGWFRTFVKGCFCLPRPPTGSTRNATSLYLFPRLFIITCTVRYRLRSSAVYRSIRHCTGK